MEDVIDIILKEFSDYDISHNGGVYKIITFSKEQKEHFRIYTYSKVIGDNVPLYIHFEGYSYQGITIPNNEIDSFIEIIKDILKDIEYVNNISNRLNNYIRQISDEETLKSIVRDRKLSKIIDDDTKI